VFGALVVAESYLQRERGPVESAVVGVVAAALFGWFVVRSIDGRGQVALSVLWLVVALALPFFVADRLEEGFGDGWWVGRARFALATGLLGLYVVSGRGEALLDALSRLRSRVRRPGG
jgi:hypothetical protein